MPKLEVRIWLTAEVAQRPFDTPLCAQSLQLMVDFPKILRHQWWHTGNLLKGIHGSPPRDR